MISREAHDRNSSNEESKSIKTSVSTTANLKTVPPLLLSWMTKERW